MSTVAQITTKRPKSIGHKTSIASAAKAMRQARVGSLLVKKGKQFIGVVTDTDIVRRAVATGKPLGKLTVEKIMTTPICTIEGNQSVDDAQDMMADLGVRHLGVTKNGDITGVYLSVTSYRSISAMPSRRFRRKWGIQNQRSLKIEEGAEP
jgi:signal-transduction protein with cAMP-binding, CBS, and nucleotidyltransferase domain